MRILKIGFTVLGYCTMLHAWDGPENWEAPSCPHIDKRREAKQNLRNLKLLRKIGAALKNLLIKTPFTDGNKKRQYAYFREAVGLDLELANYLNLTEAYDVDYSPERIKYMWDQLYKEAQDVKDPTNKTKLIEQLDRAKIELDICIRTIKRTVQIIERTKTGSEEAANTLLHTLIFAIWIAIIHGIAYVILFMTNGSVVWPFDPYRFWISFIGICLLLGYLMTRFTSFMSM